MRESHIVLPAAPHNYRLVSDNGLGMPPLVQALIVLAALILWLAPLLRMRGRNRSKTVQSIDPRARWGVLLEAIGYSIIWQSDFWNRTPELWRLALSLALLVFAVAMSFQAAGALGSHLRIDASLSTDHKLIRSGPYRYVRHPVYLSFLCLLLGSGLMIVTWPLMLIGLVVFLTGTEIRVHVEDALLATRFGQEFEAYRKSVSAYIPGIR
jgi:protein-S-isoprenylcysteine O-methyltransferase Ste14